VVLKAAICHKAVMYPQSMHVWMCTYTRLQNKWFHRLHCEILNWILEWKRWQTVGLPYCTKDCSILRIIRWHFKRELFFFCTTCEPKLFSTQCRNLLDVVMSPVGKLYIYIYIYIHTHTHTVQNLKNQPCTFRIVEFIDVGAIHNSFRSKYKNSVTQEYAMRDPPLS
jgi:hypothetical protein